MERRGGSKGQEPKFKETLTGESRNHQRARAARTLMETVAQDEGRDGPCPGEPTGHGKEGGPFQEGVG